MKRKRLFVKSRRDFLGIQNGTDAPTASSRRDFLKLSATAALGIGIAQPLAAAVRGSQSSDQIKPAFNQGKDPYALAARFNKFLRVTDVTDGLDAVGRADLTLMDPLIRPLWMGMRFWGPAVTMRVIPTNRQMHVIDRKDALLQHELWDKSGGTHAKLITKPGCVIVTSTNGARECGFWGSNNSMGMQANGVVGIVNNHQELMLMVKIIEIQKICVLKISEEADKNTGMRKFPLTRQISINPLQLSIFQSWSGN